MLHPFASMRMILLWFFGSMIILQRRPVAPWTRPRLNVWLDDASRQMWHPHEEIKAQWRSAEFSRRCSIVWNIHHRAMHFQWNAHIILALGQILSDILNRDTIKHYFGLGTVLNIPFYPLALCFRVSGAWCRHWYLSFLLSSCINSMCTRAFVLIPQQLASDNEVSLFTFLFVEPEQTSSQLNRVVGECVTQGKM